MATKRLTFGYSPCPNDTFMFDAIARGTVGIEGWRIDPVLHDVQTLNNLALEAALDISKLSFYAWMAVKDTYRLLSSGGAMGFGCGPVLVARKPLKREQIRDCRVVLPGAWTTAHLLFRLWAPDADQRFFVPYDHIFETIDSGQADCGVIIHESRFTFEEAGFRTIVDLGAWWEEQTGLPIPLGGIAVKKSLGDALFDQIDGAVNASIRQAMGDPDAALPYIRQHAQEMDAAVLKAHIHTFVNDFSLDSGATGRKALDVLESMAKTAGVL
ncbi:1,4-dihydroxy-6-naphthoate synthase [uncultured Desulfosarcina sp.]|uniref:1,4-dihydroxy-6-naphthoate synthase n=1 Tax=uncultured Desulfosarcina sp. TaxID=218289 RepID=UPI0029C63F59|nr:1,4-dihydroxy-6-naphthoate synthase [uncultured Desulfosarcina sp.]